MQKSLEQIQQENRKFILEAIHGCSYEEALKKEEGDFCHYLYQTNYGEQIIIGDVKSYGYNREKHHPDAFLIKIIGKPLTLSRVLLAFKKKLKLINFGDEIIFNIAGSQFCGLSVKDSCGVYNIFEESYAPTYTVYGICLWNPELETLEEQTEETQRKINELFND